MTLSRITAPVTITETCYSQPPTPLRSNLDTSESAQVALKALSRLTLRTARHTNQPADVLAKKARRFGASGEDMEAWAHIMVNDYKGLQGSENVVEYVARAIADRDDASRSIEDDASVQSYDDDIRARFESDNEDN